MKVLILTLYLGKRGGGNLKMGFPIHKKVSFFFAFLKRNNRATIRLKFHTPKFARQKSKWTTSIRLKFHTPKVAKRCPQFTFIDLVATTHAQQKSKWTTLMALLFIYVSVFDFFFERKWEGSAISRSAFFPFVSITPFCLWKMPHFSACANHLFLSLKNTPLFRLW